MKETVEVLLWPYRRYCFDGLWPLEIHEINFILQQSQNSSEILHTTERANATNSAFSRAFYTSQRLIDFCVGGKKQTDWNFTLLYLHSFFLKLDVQYFVKREDVFTCSSSQGNAHFWLSVMQHPCFVVLSSCWRMPVLLVMVFVALSLTFCYFEC